MTARRPIRLLLAAVVGLAVADGSVVVLGLPGVVAELDASVTGAAGVIGAYTLALTVALPAGVWLMARLGAPRAAAAGLGVFAAASVACGLAGGMEALLAARAAQALGAGVALVSAFALVGTEGRRLWTGAAIVGAAAGPALGGLLTELFDWRAIFLAQAPVIAAAAVAAGRQAAPAAAPQARTRAPAGPAIALGLVSAALTGVLFLLVLLLVTGWSLSPLEAAAVVSVLPLGALAGARVRGSATRRAVAGSALVGSGVMTLAFLPGDAVALTLLPQAVAGVGMGMALPALGGGLVPERTPADAARLLAIRHAGITLALAVLAPVTAAQLDQAVSEVRERGTALLLDAPLAPGAKLAIAGRAPAELDPVDPRAALADTLAAEAGRFDERRDRATYAALSARADETLADALTRAFAPALLLCGALGLVAAAAAAGRPGRRVLAVGLAALALPTAQAIARPALAPEPVGIADPCGPRVLPDARGIDGVLQELALRSLDRSACRHGSSREALVLALADPGAARVYAREHGVDPRSLAGLVGILAAP